MNKITDQSLIILGIKNNELWQSEQRELLNGHIFQDILKEKLEVEDCSFVGLLKNKQYYLILDQKIIPLLIKPVDRNSLIYMLLNDENILKPFFIIRGKNHFERVV